MPSTDVMLVDGAVPHWSRESEVNARVYQCLGVDKRRCRKLNKVPMAKAQLPVSSSFPQLAALLCVSCFLWFVSLRKLPTAFFSSGIA